MLTANPKSALQKKLQAAQSAAAHISILIELRAEIRSENLAYHGGAIDAGIAALAGQIDSEIDSALSCDEPEFASGSLLTE